MKRSLFPLLLILALATLESNRIFAMRAEYEKYCDVSARAQVIPPVVFEVTNKSDENLRFEYKNAQTGQLTFLEIAPKQTHNIEDAKLVYDEPSLIAISSRYHNQLIKIVTCLSRKENTTYPNTHVDLKATEFDYHYTGAGKQDNLTGRIDELRHVRLIIKNNKPNYGKPIRLERLYLY